MKLFIIGNGFDLRHGLPTSYSDFRKWLCNNYGINKKKICGVPCYRTNYRHLECFSESEFANYFLPLIDMACADVDEEEITYNGDIPEYRDWSSFEEALGYLDWTSILSEAELIYDKDGDLDPFNAGNNIEDLSNEVYDSCHILNELFKKWIDSIEGMVNECSKEKLFATLDNNNFYLNFNYTSTLETKYGIKNVKHIHGYINSFDELIIGHGNNEFDKSYFEKNYLAMNAEKPIENTFNHFRKKSQEIINTNKDFFDSLSVVNEIYVFGCSLNEIDKPYFIEIFKNIKQGSIVYLHTYDDKKYKEKEEYISHIGKAKNIRIIDWKKEIGEK